MYYFQVKTTMLQCEKYLVIYIDISRPLLYNDIKRNIKEVYAMCRSVSEGGRRCPCDSGERKRARQNAGNRAKRLKKQFEQGTKKEQPQEEQQQEEQLDEQLEEQLEQPQPADNGDQEQQKYDLSTVTSESIRKMTDEQRHELREYARERIIEMKEKTAQSYESIARSYFAQGNSTNMSPEEAEEYFQKKKNDYMDNLYKHPDMIKGNGVIDAYEFNVRELGESVHTAALVTAYENMQRESISPDDVTALDKDELLTLGSSCDPDYTIMSDADKYLIYRKNQEKYEKKTASIHNRLDNGESVDAKEFFDYITKMYGTERDDKDHKAIPTLYPSYRSLDGSITDAVHDAKITLENQGVDVNNVQIYADKNFSVKPWGYMSVSIPIHPVAQKELLNELDRRFQTIEQSPSTQNELQQKALLNFQKKQHQTYLDAIKQESGQSFGEKSIDVQFKNSNIKKEEMAQFTTLAANFPDSMIENSSEKRKPLKFVKENSFYRKDAYGRITAVVERRSHFIADDIHVGSQKEQVAFYSGNGVIRDDTGRSGDNYVVDDIASNKRLMEIASQNNDQEQYESLKQSAIEHMDKLYIRADDKKAMEDLQRKVDEQNTPTDDIFATRLYHRSLSKRRSKSQPIKVHIETFTDDFGVERAKVVSDKELATHIRENVSVVTTDGTDNTTQHELSHYVEIDPRVNIACKKFLKRRTSGLSPVLYNKADSTNNNRDELAIPDDFINSYIGKDYNYLENTEVFSMGMESIFTPRNLSTYRNSAKNNSLITLDHYTLDADSQSTRPVSHKYIPPEKEDAEHRNLILGLLSSSQKNT